MTRPTDKQLEAMPEYRAAMMAGASYFEALIAAQEAHAAAERARIEKHHEARDAHTRGYAAAIRDKKARDKTEPIHWEDRTLTRLQTMRGGGKKGRKLPEIEAPKPPQSPLAPWQPDRYNVEYRNGEPVVTVARHSSFPVWNREHSEDTIGGYLSAHAGNPSELDELQTALRVRRSR